MGNIGEAVAIFELKKKNYRIIVQNFNTSIGEIDIIASSGKILVFIEVKTRTSDDFGGPSESIDMSKVLRIRKTAGWYLAKKNETGFQDCRFDIMAIMVKKNKIRTILSKISPEVISSGNISEIAEDIMDSCIIEHIESAF